MSAKDAQDDSTSDSDDGFSCPWDGCDRVLPTESGMKQHHSKVHNESIAIADVECAWCGKSDQEYPSQIRGNFFCDRVCKGKYRSENYIGENSSNWKGGKVTVSCSYCGEPKQIFQSEASDHDDHFCDNQCKGKWRSENMTKSHHPRWTGDSVEVNCEWCGGVKMVRPWQARKDKHHFCRDECDRQWRKENVKGEKHPQWKGGNIKTKCAWCGDATEVRRGNERKTDKNFCKDKDCFGEWKSETMSGPLSPVWKGGPVPYGVGWSEKKKERIRERQDRLCYTCGKTEESNGRRLSVHHKMKARKFPDDADLERNNDDNLVALCMTCHKRWETISPLFPLVE